MGSISRALLYSTSIQTNGQLTANFAYLYLHLISYLLTICSLRDFYIDEPNSIS